MKRFVGKGGRLVRGRGRLAGPRSVLVGDTCVRARRGIVIATGSGPGVPPIPGLSEVDYWTTHDAIRAEGIIKLVIDTERDIVVGATVAAPHAGEMIGLLALAVHERTQVADLRGMIYAFPTFHGGIDEALGAYARGTGKVIDPSYATSGYLS